MNITINFREVSLRAEKSGKCITCGKRRKRVRKFCQTINPFNKNADGTVKNRFDIRTELQTQVDKWRKEPINCCSE